MNEFNQLSLLEHFSELEDPRVDRTRRHELLDIIAIAICAVVCGTESWVEIEDFGEARQEWFKKFLKLPNGIPSHDTFRRVFSLLDPKKLQSCFQSWVQTLCASTKEEIIAIDGKTLRRSFDKATEQLPLHLVSAWSSANNFVLGQVAVEDKSNEIIAIPKLLEILNIDGSIITIDAMGCQKEIAKQINEKGGDYVLCLKENHPNLHNEVAQFFGSEDNMEDIDFCETVDGDHGRIETRKCFNVSADNFQHAQAWTGIKSIAMIETEREINGKIGSEKRYYISSLETNAERLGGAVRTHWQIENSLHWVLDVTFDEDQCRIRDKIATENFAMLRRIAVGLLKNETSTNKSVRRKKTLAARDDDYLLAVLRANKA